MGHGTQGVLEILINATPTDSRILIRNSRLYELIQRIVRADPPSSTPEDDTTLDPGWASPLLWTTVVRIRFVKEHCSLSC